MNMQTLIKLIVNKYRKKHSLDQRGKFTLQRKTLNRLIASYKQSNKHLHGRD